MQGNGSQLKDLSLQDIDELIRQKTSNLRNSQDKLGFAEAFDSTNRRREDLHSSRLV